MFFLCRRQKKNAIPAIKTRPTPTPTPAPMPVFVPEDRPLDEGVGVEDVLLLVVDIAPGFVVVLDDDDGALLELDGAVA